MVEATQTFFRNKSLLFGQIWSIIAKWGLGETPKI